MARAWEKVKSRRPKPRARTPIPIRSSACSRLRKAIGALDGGEVHKGGSLGSQVRERRILVTRGRSDGRSGGPAPPGAGTGGLSSRRDPLAQGIDRHLRLFLRLPQPDVEVPALDLLLPDH